MVERQTYRDAMARLGAAVNVITTAGTAGKVGFTASAVCSVTDEPPTLLVCMNRGSAVNVAFKTNGVLCVNTLAASQEPLSGLFGRSGDITMEERFARDRWTTLATGSPVLEGAVVSFDCRIAQVTEVGTHSVVFCEVVAIQSGGAHEGLIYFGRAYHRVAPAAA